MIDLEKVAEQVRDATCTQIGGKRPEEYCGDLRAALERSPGVAEVVSVEPGQDGRSIVFEVRLTEEGVRALGLHPPKLPEP
ncbi:hypothetical protein [Deinococcus geothermalis]|uniref:hypothetical protein n=1 Tax=Deinococcus geothermalis TaxID=68909 RepID=UPI000300EBFE|nr:hypothetical protein [Deinococcus geothermalis]